MKSKKKKRIKKKKKVKNEVGSKRHGISSDIWVGK